MPDPSKHSSISKTHKNDDNHHCPNRSAVSCHNADFLYLELACSITRFCSNYYYNGIFQRLFVRGRMPPETMPINISGGDRDNDYEAHNLVDSM